MSPLNTRVEFSEITTERFRLRQLRECDVTSRYVEWFSQETIRRFITAARKPQTIETLKAYVREKRSSPSVLLLGIFEKNSQQFIGTLKFELLESPLQTAVLGVMIGEPDWQGKGVFSEIFRATTLYLFEKSLIRYYHLGVDPKNVYAMKAYKKVGFYEGALPLLPGIEVIPNQIYMVLDILKVS